MASAAAAAVVLADVAAEVGAEHPVEASGPSASTEVPPSWTKTASGT